MASDSIEDVGSDMTEGVRRFETSAATATETHTGSFWNANMSFVEKTRPIRARTDELEPQITGVSFIPEDNVFLCDNSNSKIKILSVSKGLKYEESCESQPYDVASLDDRTVIVTMPARRSIQMVLIKPGVKLADVIQLDFACYGVAVCNREIFVCVNDCCENEYFRETVSERLSTFLGIRIISLQGDILHSIPHTGPGAPNYLCLNENGDKVYYSGGRDKEAFVSCVTKDAFAIYKFSGRFLQCPTAIAVDKHENVLVCDSETKGIFVINSDGVSKKCLLTEKNELCKPTSLCYNNRCGILGIVCSADPNEVAELEKRQETHKFKLKMHSNEGKLKLFSLDEQKTGYFSDFLKRWPISRKAKTKMTLP